MRWPLKKRTSDPPGDADAASPQADLFASPPADAGSDETERLEEALAEQRQHVATLRATVEDLRFKMTILEKSYSKQLADARVRVEAAEKGLAEEKARLHGIDGNHETTLKLLSEARAQLAQATAERDFVRTQLAGRKGQATEPIAPAYRPPPPPVSPPRAGPGAPASAPRAGPSAPAPPPAAPPDNELTINALMDNLTVVAEQRRAPPPGSKPREKPKPEPPAEDMLAPDLVFPKKPDGKAEKK